MARKALLGKKIRRLRGDRGLTQAQLATDLGISASYLNLIEHDERPVTVALLLKLGQVLQLDLQELGEEDERRLAVGLREVFADALLSGFGVGPEAGDEIAAASPAAARAVVELYRAWRAAREDAAALLPGLPVRPGAKRLLLPTEEARDFFHDRTNHFPTLEEAAERIWRDAALDPGDPGRGLADYLARHVGLRIVLATAEEAGGALRRYDPASRRLILSEMLPRASRAFQLAYQAGLMTAQAEIDAIVAAAGLSSAETAALVRVGLVNYVAGAVTMPYRPFRDAAVACRYDIERLMQRFDASFEQVCHRLTTLQRPGAKGIPFWLVRVDIAGNISKRHSAAGFHFSRVGGSCSRWNVHEAFLTPGQIRTQIARLPDGATFFSIARAETKGGGGHRVPQSHVAIAIGCELGEAGGLVYADGLELADPAAVTEIGVGCRLCERADCRQRAFPPLQHRLAVDAAVKGVSAYAFVGPAGEG